MVVFAEDRNTIYFAGNMGDGIFRMRKDGSQQRRIYRYQVSSLNVVHQWIYFIGHDRDNNHNIYVIDKEGNNKTMLTNSDCRHLMVRDHLLYYINMTDSNSLYSMYQNGSNRQKIYNDSIQSYDIYKDKIYFNRSLDGKLYSMNLDTSDMNKIIDDRNEMAVIDKGWIYYINNDDDNAIYKIRIDGTARTKIAGKSDYINVKEGWLYYSSEGYIKKIRTDGTMETCLVKDHPAKGSRFSNIHLVDNYLMYDAILPPQSPLDEEGQVHFWQSLDEEEGVRNKVYLPKKGYSPADISVNGKNIIWMTYGDLEDYFGVPDRIWSYKVNPPATEPDFFDYYTVASYEDAIDIVFDMGSTPRTTLNDDDLVLKFDIRGDKINLDGHLRVGMTVEEVMAAYGLMNLVSLEGIESDATAIELSDIKRVFRSRNPKNYYLQYKEAMVLYSDPATFSYVMPAALVLLIEDDKVVRMTLGYHTAG